MTPAVATVGRAVLNQQMVAHAAKALAAAGAGNRVGFEFHRGIARALQQLLDGEYACPDCSTTYFQPQECDWCPGHQAIPASNPATH